MKVSKEEFDKFIQSYPKPLKMHTINICEPPLAWFLDESIETDAQIGTIDYIADKKVASISMDWLGPNGERAKGKEFYTYSIHERAAEDR